MLVMKQRLVIATSNPGKYREIMEVMHDLPFDIVSSGELKLSNDVVEDGDTYEVNAEKKVRHYMEEYLRWATSNDVGGGGVFVLAEDSGIQVDALVGELGVKTRRWGAGETATDEQWIDHFLYAMSGVPEEKRTARFICCAAVLSFDGKLELFKGKTEGVITAGLEAPIYGGLPISSCFRPEGFDKVYAALSIDEKNRVSHRGKAMHMVARALTFFIIR